MYKVVNEDKSYDGFCPIAHKRLQSCSNQSDMFNSSFVLISAAQDAPRVTVGNKRMTNVQLTGGDVIQGIRRNNDLGYEGNPEVPYEAAINPACPLRYTPGLKCDPALEAMRPERHPKHKAITGGDKRKAAEPTMMMVEAPPMEAPGLMPMPAFSEQFMMAPPMQQMPYMGMAPYPQQDLLSQIKMRNRRFQQSCAMEGMQGSPMMRGPVMAPTPQMMMQPQMTEEMMMMGGMTDELAMIEQDLNMTRRATRWGRFNNIKIINESFPKFVPDLLFPSTTHPTLNCRNKCRHSRHFPILPQNH